MSRRTPAARRYRSYVDRRPIVEARFQIRRRGVPPSNGAHDRLAVVRSHAQQICAAADRDLASIVKAGRLGWRLADRCGAGSAARGRHPPFGAPWRLPRHRLDRPDLPE